MKFQKLITEFLIISVSEFNKNKYLPLACEIPVLLAGPKPAFNLLVIN